MNIFNKYRSHFIAAIGSLAFLGLLILLLCLKPFGDSDSNSPDLMAEKELPIEFQKDLFDAMPIPDPNNTQNTSEESTKESQSKEMTTSNDVEKAPSDQEESVMPPNIDSVLIAEIKKQIADIKNLTPVDSLEKEQIKQNDIQQTQKALADKARNLNEDRQFYYDNYRAILSFKKVYPYVQRTKEIVNRINAQLATVTDKREKKRLIKKAEKELFEQFEKDVRTMSTSQGKLLLKLIARETDQTAYGLIKTYKGTIPATFWYGVGLLFHENLKSQYDSIGEDAQLEKIVQKYKLGKL